MSGLTISEVREALRAQLAANIAEDISVHAHPVGSYTTPAISIDLDDGDSVDYWQTFGPGGLAGVRFVVTLETGGMDREEASRQRDEFLSVGTGNSSSFIDAIHADPTLGLTGCNAKATLQGTDRATLTAEFLVEVRISKVGAEV